MLKADPRQYPVKKLPVPCIKHVLENPYDCLKSLYSVWLSLPI